MANISQKIAYLFVLIAGFYLILAGNIAQAASITVSPPKFEFTADKGNALSETITITNGEDTDLALQISTADFQAEGEQGRATFIEGSDDNSAFSLSSWIELPETIITVPANGRIELPYTIRVPEHAEAGGHFGSIFFSPVVSNENLITIQQKVGVLMLVRVSGDIIEQGAIERFATYPVGIEGNDVVATSPQRIFQTFPVSFAVRFTNTGNVHIKPQGTITLQNMFGKELTRVGERIKVNSSGAITGTELADTIPVNAEGGNVLPESARAYVSSWKGYGSQIINNEGKAELTWKGFGFGRYTATLHMQYGSTALAPQTIHFWIIPWMVVIPSLLGLIILIVLIKLWRKASRERLKQQLREELQNEGTYTDEYTDTTIEYTDPSDQN